MTAVGASKRKGKEISYQDLNGQARQVDRKGELKTDGAVQCSA